jgi:hypothetical protein
LRAPAITGTVLATGGLASALGTVSGDERTLAVYAYLLFIASLLLLRLVRRTQAVPPSDAAPLRPRAKARDDEPPIQLGELVRALSMSQLTMLDVHHRLRPLVRTIAAARLSQRHGAELDRDPERARAILGDGVVWELVRPDRDEPQDRLARGFRAADLARVVDELERI